MKLNRRKFLHSTFAAGAVLATAKASPQAIAGETGAANMENEFPWLEATIDQLQAAMTTGELTSVALTQAYLDRIATIDQAGPKLNSVIELNPDALEIARQVDWERAQGKVRGALHGIPVLVKDNFDSADQLRTTAGSLALANGRPLQDSTVIARLRQAGAILLGKTNLSEWANFRSSHSISGWSGRGGQTRNPYALDRNTSGSSSGTGAAVSANLCVVGIGTETDGSIVSPASVCGIVGVKPTVGLVSRAGIIPLAASQDTAGPMARTVRDAAHLLSVIASVDERDSATTKGRPADLPTDYAANLDQPALRGARLGVLRQGFNLHSRLTPLLDAALETLRQAGAEVIEPIIIPEMSTFGDAEFEVLLYEFKAGVNAYLASLGPDALVKNLEELIAYNTAHADTELKYFQQELLESAQAKGPLTDQAYLEARATCLRISRTEGIDAALAEHNLDALVMITSGPAWMIDPVNGDSATGGSSSWAAVSGYPSITVPMGETMGLPVGLSFTGTAWTEASLLALAADFERHSQARRVPGFLPTLSL